MSAVVVLAPIIVASWPVLAAAVVSAAASAGFRVVRKEEPKLRAAKNSVDLKMENSDVVADSLSPDQQIVVERSGIRVSFSRDARGQFRTCAEGDATKEELRKVGEDLSGRVIQQYVYRRLSQELGQSGFSTVSEEKAPDGAIRLHVRRYQE
ncbi:MAG TPA: DUF1257 domain-containing protein [Planctomycetota bacterium]|jgi:hypothetical protein|nr:DUF1257 domain-containing protein [Planctomycetota bacterium]